MSIMMTLMILLAGIGIGTVVLEGSQRSVDTDKSISAYYMADSGVERQLYEIRKVGTPVSLVTGLTSSYPNGSSWKYDGSYATATQKIISSMATTSFEVVDLFNPDAIGPANIDTVTINWQNGTGCGSNFANVEVGYAEWNLSGSIVPDQYTIQRKDNLLVTGPGDQSLTISLNPNRAYRLRLNALRCSAANIQVRTTLAGAPQGFPGDITLAAEGTYQNATQKIAVTMPKLDVLSGLFSYVVFSECTLLKGTGSPVCPP